MPSPDSFSPWITGRFLVATPAMPDPRFARSVIYMCRHSPDGALGLIINKSIDDLPMSQVLEQLDIIPSAATRDRPVLYGGPVETQRGLVLHSADYRRDETLVVDEEHALTASVEILKDIANGTGPARNLLTLGHSGWGAGQLDRELQENAWLVINDADDELVFGGDLEGKWQRALGKLGTTRSFDAAAFSHLSGRA
jgi:putative transcriptional regulator